MNLIKIAIAKIKAGMAAFIIFMAMFSIGVGFSQSRSEVSLVASGIFTSLDYDIENAHLDHSGRGSFGLGYGFYLDRRWSIHIGAEFEKFSIDAGYGALENSIPAVDIEGENFEYRYAASAYREKQELEVVSIPLTLQFQTEGEWRFYARLGAQMSFAYHAAYSATIEKLSTSGYYPQYDVELFSPKFMGFGSYANFAQGGQELEVNTFFAALLEAGVKREIDRIGGVYIGLFCNYGLNRIGTVAENKPLVEYDPNSFAAFHANSVLTTERAENIKLISYGIKLRFAIGGF